MNSLFNPCSQLFAAPKPTPCFFPEEQIMLHSDEQPMMGYGAPDGLIFFFHAGLVTLPSEEKMVKEIERDSVTMHQR